MKEKRKDSIQLSKKSISDINIRFHTIKPYGSAVTASHFDPARGWVAPEDIYESDTNASLKDIISVLKTGVEPSNEIYDAVERLLYKYQVFVLQGIRENIADHRGVSWYLVDKCNQDDKRALISYQDGPSGEWCLKCFADEVPLWLLMGLVRRIQRRKPLGDQDADDIIRAVGRLDDDYVNERESRAALKGLHLTTQPPRFNEAEA